jgi:hypothetical protein
MRKLERHRIKPLHLAFVPATITGGPLFLALARGSTAAPSSDLELAFRIAGYAGALALAIGLVVIFRIVLRQQREIEALRLELAAPNDPLHGSR